MYRMLVKEQLQETAEMGTIMDATKAISSRRKNESLYLLVMKMSQTSSIVFLFIRSLYQMAVAMLFLSQQ